MRDTALYEIIRKIDQNTLAAKEINDTLHLLTEFTGEAEAERQEAQQEQLRWTQTVEAKISAFLGGAAFGLLLVQGLLLPRLLAGRAGAVPPA